MALVLVFYQFLFVDDDCDWRVYAFAWPCLFPKISGPLRLQLIGEDLYGFVENLITDNIGGKGREYFPLVCPSYVCYHGQHDGDDPLFLYLHITPSGDGIPCHVGFPHGSGHGNRPSWFSFLSLFVPHGVPGWLIWLVVLIEVVSFISRPITLSVRLFANMVAGHVLIKVIAGFAIMFASVGGVAWIATLLPAAFNIVMIGFEIFIAFIQAYVFAVLTCIYLKDTVEIEH